MSNGSKAAGFWSYTHRDDELDGGRILRLANKLANEYELISNQPLEIFVDKKSIKWGDEWRTRINNALAGTTFFIPIVTPRYFERPECRSELLLFHGHAKSLEVQELLMPIVYVAVPALDDPGTTDEVVLLVKNAHYEDWTQLRLSDENGPEYRQAVHNLAVRLKEIASTVADRPVQPQADDQSVDDDGDRPGLFDLLAEAEESLPGMAGALDEFPEVVQGILETVQQATAEMNESKRRGGGFASQLAASRRLANDLEEPAEQLFQLGTSYASNLVAVDPGLLAIIRLADEQPPKGDELEKTCRFFSEVREMVKSAREGAEALNEFNVILDQAGGLSKDLRKPLSKMRQGIQRLVDGNAVLDEWERQIAGSKLQC